MRKQISLKYGVVCVLTLLVGCDREQPVPLASSSIAHPNSEGPEEVDFDIADAANQRGIEQYNQLHLLDAISEFDTALKIDSSNAKYYFNRACARSTNNENSVAIDDYNKAIELDASNSSWFVSRGHAWYKLADFKNAIADQHRAIEIAPDNANAYNALAIIYATCHEKAFRNGSKAVLAAEKACELTKWKEAYFIDTLAAANAENGEYDQAIKWQEKAIELSSIYSLARFQSHVKLYQASQPLRIDSRVKDLQ